MTEAPIEPFAANVATSLKLTGIGRTTLYKLIKEKRIRTYRVGARRLVDLASLRAFIESHAA
jgi:excisionase family DNA binding protein